MPPEVTENDRYCCFVCVQFTVISRESRVVRLKSAEIEIADGYPPRDIRDEYKEPVIEIKDKGPIEVRVYDGDAVNLSAQDLKGDVADAVARCKEALKAKDYRILFDSFVDHPSA